MTGQIKKKVFKDNFDFFFIKINEVQPLFENE